MPKTVPRIRTGIPRNDVIGGWFGGKPTDEGWATGRRAAGRGVLDDHAEDAAPAGQVADQGARAVVEAGRDELDELAVAAEHAQRAVAGAGQRRRRLDDPGQHAGEVEVAGDRGHGLEQQAGVGAEVGRGVGVTRTSVCR